MQFNQGAFVTGVEVWFDDRRVRGIEISYTSGESAFAGYEVGDYAKIFWDPAQTTIANAWAFSPFDRGIWALVIQLTDGKNLAVGLRLAPADPGHDSKGENVGLLLGSSGHATDDQID
jgi:hypothetical protein